ncbi:hypothetical protein NQ318_021733 [Aromia moschata]|uniref:Nucleoporin p58/p45 n=1 Tax=Aromia moschata TaxID=1265417 RepID=A0AAV8XYR8_9CUCU|nr:hypothetical protein NQ318_021733 [Aromia moschata]
MSTGFSFGTNTGTLNTSALQNQGSFGGAAQSTTGKFQFGVPTSSLPSVNLFGTQSSNLNFKSNEFVTSAQPSGFFNTPSSAPTTGLNFAVSSTATTTGFGLSDTKTVTSTNINSMPAVVGLGGLASSQTKTGATIVAQKEISLKDQPLPNEILQTVEHFKEMVKQQKLHSSDIARCSVRDFRKVEQEIDLLSNLLNIVENQLQKNRHLAEKLKYDTAKCLHNVEIAQRTQDTPPGLQYENTAPLRYFLELADLFEHEMQTLKIQIENADKYVKSHRNPDILTPQDLALGMRRLHETFVALAGRLQSVHSQVESQKETYLNIRRQVCNDISNPFDKLIQSEKELHANNIRNMLIYSPPKVATGPTPFSNLALSNGNLMYQQNQFASANSANSTLPTSSGLELGKQMSAASLFSTTPFGQTSFGNSSINFQLQKPPTGNKRGKQ